MLRRFLIVSTAALGLLISACLVTACGGIPNPLPRELPVQLPQLPDIPALPSALRDIPGVLEELGLPDLSDIAGLPGLDSLPSFETPPGGIVYRGPTERRIDPGDVIPGTDIELVSVGEDGALFHIAGMNSQRILGDSLDYDGPWPGLPGATYNLRLRIYRLPGEYVRAAGVQQLTIQNIAPAASSASPADTVMRFAYIDQAEVGALFAGTTIGYAGPDERGAEMVGLAADEYPFRKLADSVRWRGTVRADIPVDYRLRVLSYGADGARIGGTVSVSLP